MPGVVVLLRLLDGGEPHAAVQRHTCRRARPLRRISHLAHVVVVDPDGVQERAGGVGDRGAVALLLEGGVGFKRVLHTRLRPSDGEHAARREREPVRHHGGRVHHAAPVGGAVVHAQPGQVRGRGAVVDDLDVLRLLPALVVGAAGGDLVDHHIAHLRLLHLNRRDLRVVLARGADRADVVLGVVAGERDALVGLAGGEVERVAQRLAHRARGIDAVEHADGVHHVAVLVHHHQAEAVHGVKRGAVRRVRVLHGGVRALARGGEHFARRHLAIGQAQLQHVLVHAAGAGAAVDLPPGDVDRCIARVGQLEEVVAGTARAAVGDLGDLHRRIHALVLRGLCVATPRGPLRHHKILAVIARDVHALPRLAVQAVEHAGKRLARGAEALHVRAGGADAVHDLAVLIEDQQPVLGGKGNAEGSVLCRADVRARLAGAARGKTLARLEHHAIQLFGGDLRHGRAHAGADAAVHAPAGHVLRRVAVVLQLKENVAVAAGAGVGHLGYQHVRPAGGVRLLMGVLGFLLLGGLAHLDFARGALGGDEVGRVVAGVGGALVGHAARGVQADVRQRRAVRSRGVLVVRPGDAVPDGTGGVVQHHARSPLGEVAAVFIARHNDSLSGPKLLDGHPPRPRIPRKTATELVDHVHAQVRDVDLRIAEVGDLNQALTVRAGVRDLGDEHVAALRRCRRLGGVLLARCARRADEVRGVVVGVLRALEALAGGGIGGVGQHGALAARLVGGARELDRHGVDVLTRAIAQQRAVGLVSQRGFVALLHSRDCGLIALPGEHPTLPRTDRALKRVLRRRRHRTGAGAAEQLPARDVHRLVAPVGDLDEVVVVAARATVCDLADDHLAAWLRSRVRSLRRRHRCHHR